MKIKKFLSVLLIVMVAVGVFALPAAAAVKDTTRDVSLTIYALEAKDGSEVTVDVNVTGEKAVLADVKPIKGAVFELYKVADDETSTLIPLEDANVVTDPTGEDGSVKVVIPGIDQGRYLVVEESAPENVTGTTIPFLIDLPLRNPDGTDYLYDVYVYPKQLQKASPVPVTPEEDLPDPKVSKLVSGDDGKTWGEENEDHSS